MCSPFRRRLIEKAYDCHKRKFLKVPPAVILQARGNPDVHIILRGSENGPNYGSLSVPFTLTSDLAPAICFCQRLIHPTGCTDPPGTGEIVARGETFVAESKERLAKAGFSLALGVFLLMEG